MMITLNKAMKKARTAQELNYAIESIKSRLYQIYREREIEDKPITVQIIKNIYTGIHSEQKEKHLLKSMPNTTSKECWLFIVPLSVES